MNFVGFQGIRQRRQAGQILEHGHGVLIKDVEAAGMIQNNAQQVPLPRHLQTQANFALPATQGGDALLVPLNLGTPGEQTDIPATEGEPSQPDSTLPTTEPVTEEDDEDEN